MKRTKQTQFGFTLIEIILYLGIMMVIVGSVSAFSALLLSARAKAHTILEVEQQGTAILQLMSATIRGSDGINAPQAGTSASSLSLDVKESADDPTVFDI